VTRHVTESCHDASLRWAAVGAGVVWRAGRAVLGHAGSRRHGRIVHWPCAPGAHVRSTAANGPRHYLWAWGVNSDPLWLEARPLEPCSTFGQPFRINAAAARANRESKTLATSDRKRESAMTIDRRGRPSV